MSCIRCSIAILFTLAVSLAPAPSASADQDPVVDFDLPAIVEARPVVTETSDSHHVTIELRLSAIIETPEMPHVDQWLVQCRPRGSEVTIVDYSPRTETASNMAGPIQVKQTLEAANAVGISVDGAYGHMIGNAGADVSKKSIDSLQFDRVAPLHAVTASGTINRGRGVYFKLRATAQQILDGEKCFKITLEVPAEWRGGLIDVDVVAQSGRKKFAWERDSKTIGSQHFVVAAYRRGDQQAAELAEALTAAETSLRQIAAEHRASAPRIPTLLKSLATKLQLDPSSSDSWVQRLILNQADPRLDEEICDLPMPIRIAVLDYADLRDQFVSISTGGEIEKSRLVNR